MKIHPVGAELLHEDGRTDREKGIYDEDNYLGGSSPLCL